MDGYGKAKHIVRNLLWIQQRVKQGIVNTNKVHTDVNIADLGTKHLSYDRIVRLLSLMGLSLSSKDQSFGFKAQL